MFMVYNTFNIEKTTSSSVRIVTFLPVFGREDVILVHWWGVFFLVSISYWDTQKLLRISQNDNRNIIIMLKNYSLSKNTKQKRTEICNYPFE